MFKKLINMTYTTSDSESDEDYNPLLDHDYGREYTDEEEYETDSTDDTVCFENILEEKEKEIQELNNIIEELRQILKTKIDK